MKKTAIFMAIFMCLSALGGCTEKKESVANRQISIYLPLTAQQDDDMVFEAANKIIGENLGVELDFNCIDIGSYKEKMRMNMSSGKDFDICWTGYLNDANAAGKKGGIIELGDLIDKNAPKLKEAIPEFVWKDAKSDGNLYCVPNYQIMALPPALFIRKDFYDKYNVADMNIKNTREVEPLLAKIKEDSPDIFPFRTVWHVDSFRGEKDNPVEYRFNSAIFASVEKAGDKKYKIAPIYESKTFVANVKTLRDWYNKGYIRSDIASVLDDNTEWKSGKYAVTIDGYKPGIEAGMKTETGYDYVPIVLEKATRNSSTATQTALSIGANCKDPETAIKVIELINTNKELYNILCFGIEGEHYTKLDDGRIELKSDSRYNHSEQYWIIGNTMNALVENTKPTDYLKQCDEINKSAVVSPLSAFKFDNSSVKTEIANCSSVYEQYKLIRYGAVEPDEYLLKLKEDLDNAGVAKIVEEDQKQIDAFMEKQ